MNKKILFCGAIATALFLTACVKKEAPHEEAKDQAEMQNASTVQEPTQFQPLQAADQTQPKPAAPVAVIQETKPEKTSENENLAKDDEKPLASKNEATVARLNIKDKPATEDDAVAAAIAAAQPALKN